MGSNPHPGFCFQGLGFFGAGGAGADPDMPGRPWGMPNFPASEPSIFISTGPTMFTTASSLFSDAMTVIPVIILSLVKKYTSANSSPSLASTILLQPVPRN